MLPFLRPGDTVEIDWIRPEEPRRWLEVGEIVLFRSATSSEWIIHRIVAPGPEVKGDRAFSLDAVENGAIWGVAVQVDPGSTGKFRPICKTPLDRSADRLLARLSKRALPPETLQTKLARQVVFVLGWWRRHRL